MILTSIGIFGFLSKAHLDQAVPSTNVAAQVSLLDEKINLERENINVARKALQQLDKTVDETIARSSSEEGVIRAANLRRTQQAERRRLQGDIENAQNNISRYTEERQPLAVQLRSLEAKVGPIKYIAALIYGDNLDSTLLESAVRIVIILIVAVFDPLALILIIAAQQSLRWVKVDQKTETVITNQPIVSTAADSTVIEKSDDKDDTQIVEKIEEISVESPPNSAINTEKKDDFDWKKFPYLNKFDHFKDITPLIYKDKNDDTVVPETVQEISTPPETITDSTPVDIVSAQPSITAETKIPETAARYKAPIPVVPETLNVRRKVPISADTNVKTDFGTMFPTIANKGDSFLRVDFNPNKLFKFNGFKWIEIDKSQSDSYSYNEKYIDFLIEKISNGEYDIDQLSGIEQELIAEKLKRNNEHT
jgi:hypothetical protein